MILSLSTWQLHHLSFLRVSFSGFRNAIPVSDSKFWFLGSRFSIRLRCYFMQKKQSLRDSALCEEHTI